MYTVKKIFQCSAYYLCWEVMYFRSRPCCCLRFHKSIEVMHVIVYGLLVLCSGTHSLGSENMSQYT